MRRLTSTLIGAAVAAASVLSVASPASAAPGDVTETAITNAVPASPAGMRPYRVIRLSRTGEFLAVGRVPGDGTGFHMWQLKPDLSLDTSFGTGGVVDLGVADTTPCNVGNNTVTCSGINSLTYNEVSNTYFVTIYTSVKTTTFQYPVSRIVTGNLKTGAVTSRVNLREANATGMSSSYESEFAALNIPVTSLAKDECTAVNGASVNGAAFSYGSTNSSAYIVPSGTIVLSFWCNYDNSWDANGNPVTPSGTYRSYRMSHYAGYKVANNTLTLDTTFGTGGRMILVDGKSVCDNGGPGGATTDLGITTMSSTKPYTMLTTSTTARVTTFPQGWNNSGWSGYDGCGFGGPSSTLTYNSKLYSVTVNGKVTEVLTFPTSSTPFFASRWVIDPAGRWVTLAQSSSSAPTGPNTPNSTTRTFVAIRVKDGKADATFGTDGQKTLALPANTTIGGVSFPMNYFLTGMVTTKDEVFFMGSTNRTSTPNGSTSFSCTPGTTVTSEFRPFVFSLKTGDIVKTFGTDGLGAAATSVFDSGDFCGGFGTSSFVDSKGRFSLFRARPAIGSQTAGNFLYTWDAVANATGGGDGGTGTGGATKDTGGAAFAGEKPFSAALAAAPAAGGALTVAGRVDAKVYAKAPAKVEANTALTVLRPSEADDLDIVTSTPKVCIALTTSVVFTGTGRCTVRILDEETRRVVRSFSTVVAAAESTVGTALTTDKPIMFGQLRTSLSATARAQVKELATAATGAGRILILGHSASLYGNEVSNRRISLERAAAVKRAMIAAGVKNPISIVAMGSRDMANTGRTEAQQALNRRVEVFIYPAAN